MDDVGDAGGEGGVAGGVIAVIGRDDDGLDRLRRHFPDRVDQPFRLGDAALAVGDQHAVVGDDEHVGGGELLGAGVEVLVGVDVVGNFDRARKVAQLHAALDRIGGADDRWLCEDERSAEERRLSEARRSNRRNMRMGSLL